MEPSLFHWIECEHETLETWLDQQLARSIESGRPRAALAEQIEDRVRLQIEREEILVYQPLVLASLRSDLFAQLISEQLFQHSVLLDRLRRLRANSDASDWPRRLAELRSILRTHYEEEESQIHEVATALLSS